MRGLRQICGRACARRNSAAIAHYDLGNVQRTGKDKNRMVRPPLPIGTWGKIGISHVSEHSWRASATFRGFDGKTRKVTATAASAEASVRKLTAALLAHTGVDSGDLASTTTLTIAAELWLDEIAFNVAGSTFDNYRLLVRGRILPALGARRLREITVGTVDRFLRSEAERTPSQARNVRSVLRQIMSLAVRHDAIRSNPVVDAGRIRIKHHPPRALSLPEITRLRRHVAQYRTGPGVHGPKPNNDIPDLVDVMLSTGARIGEALALRWCDIDLDSAPPTLTISGTIVEESGRPPYRKDSPKTKAGYRTLILPNHAVSVLKRRREAGTSGFVFPSRNGDIRPVQDVHRYWRQLIKGTEFEWVKLHILRKTVATHLSDEIDDDHAARQLGHSSPDVTRRHYIQRAIITPDVTRTLNELFTGYTE